MTVEVRTAVLRALAVGAVTLAVLAALEYFGVTDQGYEFAVAYVVVFTAVYTAIDVFRRRRQRRDRRRTTGS